MVYIFEAVLHLAELVLTRHLPALPWWAMTGARGRSAGSETLFKFLTGALLIQVGFLLGQYFVRQGLVHLDLLLQLISHLLNLLVEFTLTN